jgi:tetratricopeptide (TPR) repeat protein
MDEALVLLTQAEKTARESGSFEHEGMANLHLGFLHGVQGKQALARQGFENALRILEGTSREIFRVDASYHLGDLALQQGDFTAAESYVEIALALARRLGYRTGLTQALNFAAMVHDAAGRNGDALSALREAVSVARENGDLMNAATGLTNFGYALLREERLEEAESAFAEAEDAAERGRNAYAAGFAAAGLGDVRRRRGRLVDAWMAFERAIQLMDMAGVKPGVLRVKAKLGGVMAESGEREQAIAQLQACIKEAEQLGLSEELELAKAELAQATGASP